MNNETIYNWLVENIYRSDSPSRLADLAREKFDPHNTEDWIEEMAFEVWSLAESFRLQLRYVND